MYDNFHFHCCIHQFNDFVKTKDRFGLARTEGTARAVASSLEHCRVVTE